ncbi:MAG: hypothetical protein JW904_07870 [Spirochaetales bacterium]|nr:hypothetical protein [Spirochaetales bacterium]
MIDVLCIGYACYDLIYYPDIPIQFDRKYFVRKTDESGGGPAANAAFLLSSWQIPTAFAGLLGKDRLADTIIAEFQAAGTNTALIKQDQSFSTPFSSIVIHPDTGERTIFTRHMDPPAYLPEWDSLPCLSPKIILADGHQLEATLEARERFPKAILVLDAGSLREATKSLLPITDIAICSEPFACSISQQVNLAAPEKKRKALFAVKKECPGRIAITLGSNGVVFLENETMHHIPAFPVQAIDTTAAGDIFHGSFVYAHLLGMSFHDGLYFASAAAALSVTHRGGRNSIPKITEVNNVLQNQNQE